MSSLLFILFTLLLSFAIASNIQPIYPTTINETGEYYITSKSYDFSNQSIICNYYNITHTSKPRNCYILCDKLKGCMHTMINYNKSPKCSINCTTNQSCSSSFINSSNSNTFDLQCHGHSSCFKLDVLYNNTNTINIQCNQNQSCSNITINGNYSKYSSISCLYNNSCSYSHIILSNINNVSLLCNGSIYNYRYQITPSCLNLTLTVINSSIINITSGLQLKYSNITVKFGEYFILDTIDQLSIKQTQFDLYNIKNVFLTCYYDSSCLQTVFNIFDNSNVTWWCGYKGKHTDYTAFNSPCTSSILYAPHAKLLNVVRNSMDISNEFVTIHGPEYYNNYTNNSTIIARSNIKCIYYGCLDAKYISRNGLLDWNIYFYFPVVSDQYCYAYCDRFYPNNWKDGSEYTACVMDWEFNCGPLFYLTGSYNPIFDGPDCIGQCCNQIAFNNIKIQFNNAMNTFNDICDDEWDIDISTMDWIIIIAAFITFISICSLCEYWKKRRKKYMHQPLL